MAGLEPMSTFGGVNVPRRQRRIQWKSKGHPERVRLFDADQSAAAFFARLVNDPKSVWVELSEEDQLGWRKMLNWRAHPREAAAPAQARTNYAKVWFGKKIRGLKG